MTRRAEALQRVLVLLVAGLLASCGDDRSDATAPPPGLNEGAANVASQLDALAAEEGVIPDGGDRSPEGGYGRTYPGGRDRLCLVQEEPGRYRFAAEVRIGQDQGCRGGGEARLDGGELSLTFDGAECRIDARYEGDRLVLPGRVEEGCARLCSRRGSFAGVTFPRIGDGRAMASSMTDSQDEVLCR